MASGRAEDQGADKEENASLTRRFAPVALFKYWYESADLRLWMRPAPPRPASHIARPAPISSREAGGPCIGVNDQRIVTKGRRQSCSIMLRAVLSRRFTHAPSPGNGDAGFPSLISRVTRFTNRRIDQGTRGELGAKSIRREDVNSVP